MSALPLKAEHVRVGLLTQSTFPASSNLQERSLCQRHRIASCAKGCDGPINRRINFFIACKAVTSQIIDRISRNGDGNHGNTKLGKFTLYLEQHFGRRVVDVIDTSNVENKTMDGFCRSGDESKNFFDEKASVCVKQIRFKTVDNYARRCELVWRRWHGTPARFAILYQNAGPWLVGVANLIDQ